MPAVHSGELGNSTPDQVPLAVSTDICCALSVLVLAIAGHSPSEALSAMDELHSEYRFVESLMKEAIAGANGVTGDPSTR